jgi:hypothetical protein
MQDEQEEVKPCLVLFNGPDGLVCMLNNNEFDAPGIWGIVLADVVQHLVNAYAREGMSGPAVRQEIVKLLMAELDKPTAKAKRVEEDWVYSGFCITGDEE